MATCKGFFSDEVPISRYYETMRMKKGSVNQLSDIPGIGDFLDIAVPGMDRNAYLQCDSRMDFHDGIANYFAWYQGRKLISLLTMFTPWEKSAEVSAMTLPDHRREGLFGRLYETAKEELLRFGYESLLLVESSLITTGFSLPGSLGLKKEHSEYQLVYEKDASAVSADPGTLTVRRGEPADRELLLDLNQKIFPGDAATSAHIIDTTLADETREFYLCFANGTPVGICAAAFADKVYLYSIGISPECQGQGYGKGFLRLVLDLLSPKGLVISLEADSDNERALRLYRGAGFVDALEYRFYRVPLKEEQ